MAEIILDTRESDKKFTSYFIVKAHSRGHTVREEALEFGDIKCGDIIIERKEINDFVSSITSPRMWDQISKMKENPAYKAMVVVCGTVNDLNTHNLEKISEMYGGVAKLLRLGIPVHFMPNEVVFTTHALNMLEKSEDIDVPIKHVNKQESLSIIRSFPGIGEKSGKEIKKKFGITLEFLKYIVSADEKEMQKFFGKAKGSRIYKALRE